nr:hypothetical protein [Kibdelosporangium philippinense]
MQFNAEREVEDGTGPLRFLAYEDYPVWRDVVAGAGVRQSRFVLVDAGIPSRASGRVMSRGMARRAWAMLVTPVMRWAMMARLRRLAVARGVVPVRSREWSSR